MAGNSTRFLKTLKYGAITLAVLMVAGIATVMLLARGNGEDITGVVAPALLVTIASIIAAIVAAFAQRRVQREMR